MSRYILKFDKPVHVSNVNDWATWFETAERSVARDVVNGILISTVFLGIDHRVEKPGLPLLWETMAFSQDEQADECQRYTSREEALLGHMEFVQLAHELPQ